MCQTVNNAEKHFLALEDCQFGCLTSFSQINSLDSMWQMQFAYWYCTRFSNNICILSVLFFFKPPQLFPNLSNYSDNTLLIQYY